MKKSIVFIASFLIISLAGFSQAKNPISLNGNWVETNRTEVVSKAVSTINVAFNLNVKNNDSYVTIGKWPSISSNINLEKNTINVGGDIYKIVLINDNELEITNDVFVHRLKRA